LIHIARERQGKAVEPKLNRIHHNATPDVPPSGVTEGGGRLRQTSHLKHRDRVLTRLSLG
ncbi:MAG: hypothetical protein AAF085_13295, partial [Planctomycetota bacterium]